MVRSSSLLLLGALTLGCAGRGAQSPAVYDDPWPRIVEQASHDFACPVDEITPGPCACIGATVVFACGVGATYGFERREDGGYDVYLVTAVLPGHAPRSR